MVTMAAGTCGAKSGKKGSHRSEVAFYVPSPSGLCEFLIFT
jgi:hypothetical protein